MTSYHRSPHSPQSLQLRQNPEKMSITQTFYLAHKARGKLSSEASRQDHNLRLLVGHANLLDTLMIHLSEAERDQERWFNTMVRGNEESREYRDLPETIEEEPEEYGSLAADYDSDSDSSEESDDEEMEDVDVTYTIAREPSYKYYQTQETIIGVSEAEVDEDRIFSLTRTRSRRPPSLCSDYSDDEEEESNPPSPPQPTIPHPPLSHKEHSFFAEHHGSEPQDLFEYYEPQRAPAMISSY
ncbi:hypothetical protein B9Z19DRAFT_90165 [Tuber borchii]|uniref:Uncharacterized protein n=1 Tax=Tuber borchii TaxID=42251 RepID=A0A2T6ZRR9_TUBBO|nr:hypothetical protein B9Z19DRAFT_90165 [Tuber borchii]